MRIESPEIVFNCTSENEVLIILPVFNEASRQSNQFWDSLVSKSGVDFLFIDDASTDNSLDQLSLYRDLPNVGLLRLHTNMGKAESIRQAFLSQCQKKSNHLYIGYLDSDGAFSADETARHIPKAVEKLNEGFSIYSVSRVLLSGRNIDRKVYRHIIGRLIRTLIGLKFKNLPYDTQSGFKLFNNDPPLEEVMAKPFRTKWFVDVELINRRQVMVNDGKLIWEEPALTWTDVGNSSIKLSASLQIIADIFRILRIEK
jgi:dolichyl-phosphate beta-glucosyltransferase